MAHIKVALKCVTPSNEYKKKTKKQRHEHKKKFLLLNAAEIYRFIQSLNEKKILSNNTKLQSLVTLSVGSF